MIYSPTLKYFSLSNCVIHSIWLLLLSLFCSYSKIVCRPTGTLKIKVKMLCYVLRSRTNLVNKLKHVLVISFFVNKTTSFPMSLIISLIHTLFLASTFQPSVLNSFERINSYEDCDFHVLFCCCCSFLLFSVCPFAYDVRRFLFYAIVFRR